MNRKVREQLLACKLTLKRLLTRKNFWVMLVLLPLLLICISQMQEESKGLLRAAVYCREEALKPLLTQQDDVDFFFVESVEEVKRQVLAGKAECGYVIPEDLYEAFEEDDWSWKVEVYEGPHSMFTKLIDEVMFSRIFEQVSVDWYGRFMEGKLSEEVSDMPGELQEKLADVFAGRETFQIQTVSLTEFTPSDREESWKDAGIRAEGIVAVMLYLMSLLSLMDVVKDREQEHFRRQIRLPAAFWTIFHPVAMVGVSGLAALCLTQTGMHAEDIGRYLALIVVTVLYALLLSVIVRKSNWLYGFIPVLFIAGFVCCPVFVDLGMVFPVFGWIKWLFPFAFYL